MSNSSLKEQLASLLPKPSFSKVNKTNSPPSKKHVKKSSWLEYTFYGIELLKAHFPNCFKDAKEVRPLKIGIKQDLVKSLSTRADIVIADKSCMIKSLSYYVGTLSYLRGVKEGSERVDLEGAPSGSVTKEEAEYSTQQYEMKLQKKSARQGKPAP